MSIDVTRWDEKAGLRRHAVRSQVIDVLKAQIKRRPAIKKISTLAAKPSKKISQPKLTVGLDLGDRNSWYCVLDESGQTVIPRSRRRSLHFGLPYCSCHPAQFTPKQMPVILRAALFAGRRTSALAGSVTGAEGCCFCAAQINSGNVRPPAPHPSPQFSPPSLSVASF
jgi:hypothetical protein